MNFVGVVAETVLPWHHHPNETNIPRRRPTGWASTAAIPRTGDGDESCVSDAVLHAKLRWLGAPLLT